MPEESATMKAARQRLIQAQSQAQQAGFEQFITENMGLWQQQVMEFA